MFKRAVLALALFVTLVVIGSVVAQDLGFGDPFHDICVSNGAPVIEAMPVPYSGVYYRSQFINTAGDIVIVYFGPDSRAYETRAVYPGSYKWCAEAQPR